MGGDRLQHRYLTVAKQALKHFDGGGVMGGDRSPDPVVTVRCEVLKCVYAGGVMGGDRFPDYRFGVRCELLEQIRAARLVESHSSACLGDVVVAETSQRALVEGVARSVGAQRSQR